MKTIVRITTAADWIPVRTKAHRGVPGSLHSSGSVAVVVVTVAVEVGVRVVVVSTTGGIDGGAEHTKIIGSHSAFFSLFRTFEYGNRLVFLFTTA